MGNIIGESIPDYVGKQIEKRQKIYGSGTLENPRSIDQISYLNSRTSWIKLASGTSMEQNRLDLLEGNPMITNTPPGLSLARENVLFNGLAYPEDINVKVDDKTGEVTSFDTRLGSRQGIVDNWQNPIDKAYGVGGRDFGFSPMPGIINADIKSLNRGSLKKATINIKVHNKNQLDVIDVLYMRLGYTVLLEWGNNKYFDNDGDYRDMGPTLIEREFFKDENNETSYTKWLPLIETERKEKSGNYEAMFGVISNFSWTFESDGSYNVKIDIISMGDVIESLKVNVPVYNFNSINETQILQSQEIQEGLSNLSDSRAKNEEQFKNDFVDPDTNNINSDKAKTAKYSIITENDFKGYIRRITSGEAGSSSQVKLKLVEDEEDRQQKLKSIANYYEDGIFKNYSYKDEDGNYWYFEMDSKELWEIVNGGARRIEKESNKLITYDEDLKEFTTTVAKEEEVREKYKETQVTKLKESKLTYLFFQIQEIAVNPPDTVNPPAAENFNINLLVPNFSKLTNSNVSFRQAPNDPNKIGTVLNANSKFKSFFPPIGLPETTTADIISTEISSNENKNYYMRFGTLLEYMRDHIFPKIITFDDLNSPLLKVDTEVENNIMYTIPNQLSTNPEICIIKNTINHQGLNNHFFSGLEDYIGTESNIQYGKVMNIYLNFNYLRGLLSSGDIISDISVFSFLSNICNSINSSLGKVNNLEPIIDEATNTIIIIEQTKIPGKNKLIEILNVNEPTPYKPPILEIFGYNPENNTSNFVRNVGLQTAITKEYATMITLGATKNGYVPGEEATAFSKWNTGIEDRFKTGIKDGDSDTKDPVVTFEKDNAAIKSKYNDYLNQDIEGIIGVNGNEEDNSNTLIINSETIKINTSTVVNHNKYLQASASIANPSPDSVETSVGFLPFNLSLDMDGIGGIKIYNKLDVNLKFLPSNYKESMEFVVTGVNHKLSNNEWVTSLSTIGTSKGTDSPSKIIIGNNSTDDNDIDSFYPTFSTDGEQANLLRSTLKELGYVEKGDEIDNGGDISVGIRKAGQDVFKTIKQELPKVSLRVTSGNDSYHQGIKKYTSRHKTGRGLDFTISPSTKSNLDKVVNILQRYAAGNNPNFRFIDEYRHRTSKGTANHFHISWGPGTEAQVTLNESLLLAKEGKIKPLTIA